MCKSNRTNSSGAVVLVGIAALGLAGALHASVPAAAPSASPVALNATQVESQAAAQNAQLGVQEHALQVQQAQVKLQAAQASAVWSERLAMVETVTLGFGVLFALATAIWLWLRLRARFGGRRPQWSDDVLPPPQFELPAPRQLALPPPTSISNASPSVQEAAANPGAASCPARTPVASR
jgi:hypothetical protein